MHLMKGNLMAFKWQDKRDVHMLTTLHENFKTDENIWRPLAINDMQLSFVECVRKSVKWYEKLFFHLVDMTVFNCNIMHMMKSGEKRSLEKFRNELVRGLLTKYSIPHPKRLVDRHFATKVPLNGGARLRTRTCFVCSHSKTKERKRSLSRFECKDCNVGLCVPDCFIEYHTLLHF